MERIVSVDGQFFIDELGRLRIFRGTNVVVKTWPYVPDTRSEAGAFMSFNSKDVEILSNRGVTAIRLGIMWPGVEPTRGNYNQTYLNEMVKIVQMCSDAGIYVLLDFHQDVFSKRFCGEGVPDYIADTNPNASSGPTGFPIPFQSAPYSVDTAGNPSEFNCSLVSWPMYQGTFSVAHGYDQLYNNLDNVRDYFISYWTLVAKTFLKFKNIIGYDIINEPFYGDIYKDITLTNAAVANTKNLQPFYDVVAAAIRAVDTNAIIHFESVTLIQQYDYFTKVPGGSNFANTSVFNFHYYKEAQTDFDVNSTIGFRLDSARALGCGVFLGEFEMGYGQAGANIPAIQNTLDAVDYHMISVTGWEYKDYVTPGDFIQTGTNNGLVDTSTGLIRPDMERVYSRTYAHAIAGIPISMCFDNTTSAFALLFTFNGKNGTAGTTVLRTNFNSTYPNGFSVQISAESGTFIYSTVNNSILIQPDIQDLPLESTAVSVYIASKSGEVSQMCPLHRIPKVTAATSTALTGNLVMTLSSGSLPKAISLVLHSLLILLILIGGF
ncbi:hypothetical protein HDU84_002236 [Entophlyctis sp. JEL0112]|nr:hypothetical protein HDU84_002236 [Entophlyctis sp. JEL0112]